MRWIMMSPDTTILKIFKSKAVKQPDMVRIMLKEKVKEKVKHV
ncbi:MAG: hypothetical protein WC658_04745 [Candidatus Omnitrophota bacterium]